MKVICIILFISWYSMAVGYSQPSPIGTWKTVDDRTGDTESYVEIYEKDGKVYGKITNIFQGDPNASCTKCSGNRKDKPIMGMVIIENLRKEKSGWGNGNILDPKSGSLYTCSIWLENNKPDELRVRGRHWSGIYRTQTWYRIKS